MVFRDIETIVVGTGASGYNAADLLSGYGVKDLAIITESKCSGTSRNTGSDKQTYYKLSLSGEDLDSVRTMAMDLFRGKCVDGDNALCEAALSVPSFIRLSLLGVPFPMNRYGEYVGYKTDHDPFRRATSVGPYTSRYMTEALERNAERKNIEVIDGYQLVKLIISDRKLKGAVFLSRDTGSLLVARCRSLVLATGGPAGIYEMSVYPESQFGATGVALEASCSAQNLTEWQYGLSSVKPRWNVSGSYMQAIPRFLSIDENGNEHDFLSEYPSDDMLARIFLKGYQWPFDARKLESGSSIIDILCYLEMEKGRRVYLDYMHNPGDIRTIGEEGWSYLERAGAIAPLPIDRLRALNEPAYEFYLERGIDLEKEYLEIALSAQHNNGGLSVDLWWQSDIKGIFPVGECAGTHGVYRPGGSALNAGQVGSRRAAEYIAKNCSGKWIPEDIFPEDTEDIEMIIKSAENGTCDLSEAYRNARMRMSINASCLRNCDDMKTALEETEKDIASFHSIKASAEELWLLFEYRSALIAEMVYLSAMIDHAERRGGSRGSAIYTDKDGDLQPVGLDERFRYTLEQEDEPLIQQVRLLDGIVEIIYRKARPIPSDDASFERVWAEFRKNECIF